MKQTVLNRLLAIGAVSVVALSTAFAQTSTTTTTSAGDTVSSSTTTSSLDGTGTITTYSPGADYISMRTETSDAPTRYYYSKNTTVVDPSGATVDMALLRP